MCNCRNGQVYRQKGIDIYKLKFDKNRLRMEKNIIFKVFDWKNLIVSKYFR